jgi:hypothetical protein
MCHSRVMIGRQSAFAAERQRNELIGTDFAVNENLGTKLPDSWWVFNEK